jgi:cold shock CspA family protein
MIAEREEMNTSGRVTKINTELGYGFINVPKVGDVFFSAKTAFDGTAFESLKVNDLVRLSVTETERGLFAQTLAPEVVRSRDRVPEATV